jgi:hypothetical protein
MKLFILSRLKDDNCLYYNITFAEKEEAETLERE